MQTYGAGTAYGGAMWFGLGVYASCCAMFLKSWWCFGIEIIVIGTSTMRSNSIKSDAMRFILIQFLSLCFCFSLSGFLICIFVVLGHDLVFIVQKYSQMEVGRLLVAPPVCFAVVLLYGSVCLSIVFLLSMALSSASEFQVIRKRLLPWVILRLKIWVASDICLLFVYPYAGFLSDHEFSYGWSPVAIVVSAIRGLMIYLGVLYLILGGILGPIEFSLQLAKICAQERRICSMCFTAFLCPVIPAAASIAIYMLKTLSNIAWAAVLGSALILGTVLTMCLLHHCRARSNNSQPDAQPDIEAAAQLPSNAQEPDAEPGTHCEAQHSCGLFQPNRVIQTLMMMPLGRLADPSSTVSQDNPGYFILPCGTRRKVCEYIQSIILTDDERNCEQAPILQISSILQGVGAQNLLLEEYGTDDCSLW
eukprot:CAMPEP_0172763438 /NCGR_PEP_ID=MMETSP1074-20121228/175313_1 /TAXON_ID=2916 /ORGANISM="Ceratium fusus, Strain PA161109" /LENGTH=419 /DNA_ID=CAMNT_0013598007 /DNA_START=130 /DNA_END=1386 /DNA_ORIENTATION=+